MPNVSSAALRKRRRQLVRGLPVIGGAAVILSSANVLVTGDLFTHRSYPVIDESSGGSLRGIIEAVVEKHRKSCAISDRAMAGGLLEI